jgi:hypothetical protein
VTQWEAIECVINCLHFHIAYTDPNISTVFQNVFVFCQGTVLPIQIIAGLGLMSLIIEIYLFTNFLVCEICSSGSGNKEVYGYFDVMLTSSEDLLT